MAASHLPSPRRVLSVLSVLASVAVAACAAQTDPESGDPGQPGTGGGSGANGGAGGSGGAGATAGASATMGAGATLSSGGTGGGVSAGGSAGAGTTGGAGGATGSGASSGMPAAGGASAGQGGMPPLPPGGGFVLDGTCVAACAAGTADADGDGCGFDTRDCVLTSAPYVANAMACEYTGVAPAPGDGFFMGCRCVRPCTGPDTSDPTTDGWGWEFGATCVVSGGAAAMGKAACVPPAAATGDGYLIKTTVEGTTEEIEKCVPACERPDWVEDPDGWGYEHRDTCIVEGSKAEMQVARCTLVPRTFPWEAGPGYMLKDGTTMQETCYPPCANPDDTDPTDDGWGWEQERACIVPMTKPALQGAPCIPADPAVTGTCPTDTMCPVVDNIEVPCGCSWVDGFAERKAEIVAVAMALGSPSWGDPRYFLASAMMETNTLKADYPLGDVYPGGQPKTGDAFNAGIAKQGWSLMKQCHPPWNGSSDYMQAAAMNSDLMLDAQVYDECRTMFGMNWWSGHRNGAGSLGQSTHDIRVFKAAMDWTWTMLQEGGGHFADDVYFWADVTPI